MNKPIIIVGGGDHGAVVADILLLDNRQILGITDPALEPESNWRFGLKVLGNDSVIHQHAPETIELANGIGYLPHCHSRRELYQQWSKLGYRFSMLVHPAATICREAAIEEGAQVMAGAVVNVGARLGKNCLINSAAVIEHGVSIGNHSHVAPGAVVCGGSKIGEACFIGANATVVHYQTLTSESIVKAGALVSKKTQLQSINVMR